MRILMILPPLEVEKEIVLRVAGWIEKRFAAVGVVDKAALTERVSYYEGILNGHEIYHYELSIEGGYDILVFMNGTYTPHPPIYAGDIGRQFRQVVYTADRWGRLVYVNREIDTFEYEHIESHVFSKLSSRSANADYFYFPYGFLLRWTGMGPINQFGFRINFDYKHLVNRDVNHKVIAVFGGSTTFSMFCLHDDMFSSQLETMLNNHSKVNALPYSFTVLNFGMLSHVMLNELLTYLLFVDAIKPDYVIAHDGYNDLTLGMTSDPYLVNHHQICYPEAFERWSHILHNTSDIQTTQKSSPFEVLNLPQNIINSYIYRKKQFKSVVEASGATFIWGLQSYIDSKNELALIERECIGAYTKEDHCHTYTHNKMPFMYEKLIEVLNSRKIDFVDVHSFFNKYGKESELFVDTVHTTPEGDRHIAECYFEFLKASF